MQVYFINIKWNQLCDAMLFHKSVGTKVLYSVPCPEVITDDFSVHVSLTNSDGSCIDWWVFFFFFLALFHFFSRALWVEWWLLLLLSSTWQRFKVFPQIPNVRSNSLHTIYPEGQSPRSWYIGASLSSAGDGDWRERINVDHKHCG